MMNKEEFLLSGEYRSEEGYPILTVDDHIILPSESEDVIEKCPYVYEIEPSPSYNLDTINAIMTGTMPIISTKQSDRVSLPYPSFRQLMDIHFCSTSEAMFQITPIENQYSLPFSAFSMALREGRKQRNQVDKSSNQNRRN
jgi:hypothetical protein